MFCARCGQQVPNATEICPLCGREASLRLVPQLAPDIPWVSKASLPISTLSPGPSGVRGWLLFYCLGLTLLGPAYILILLYFVSRFSTVSYRLVTTHYFMDFLRVLFGLVVGIFLWMRRPGSLVLLKGYFIYIAAVTALFTLEAVSAMMRSRSSIASSRFTSILFSTGITLLWFLYFRRSVRVRNTYGANL